jgi:hypothetical protein
MAAISIIHSFNPSERRSTRSIDHKIGFVYGEDLIDMTVVLRFMLVDNDI